MKSGDVSCAVAVGRNDGEMNDLSASADVSARDRSHHPAGQVEGTSHAIFQNVLFFPRGHLLTWWADSGEYENSLAETSVMSISSIFSMIFLSTAKGFQRSLFIEIISIAMPPSAACVCDLC